MKPARHEKREPGRRLLRPSSAVLAAHGQHDRHRVGARVMLRPAFRAAPRPAGLVDPRSRAPHCAQNPCRACQSISERASARIAASPAGDQRRQRAHIDRIRHPSRAALGAGGVDREERPVLVEAEKDAGSRRRRSARATAPTGCQSSAGWLAWRATAASGRASAGCGCSGSSSSPLIHALSVRRPRRGRAGCRRSM